MSSFRILSILAVVVLWTVATSLGALAFTGQKYSSQAKISMEQARSIAKKAVPGKIVKEELEKERGGSGLRYSFDIARRGVTHEVGVDAKTGKVLEKSIEGKESREKG